MSALKIDDVLQELYLADNRLVSSDGIQIGNMLKHNCSLQLLDLRNNHLQVIPSFIIVSGIVHAIVKPSFAIISSD